MKQPTADPLRGRVEQREARIGILGLGYVGLPLAHAFSRAGFYVLGFDVDPVKVSTLNRGSSYLGHFGGELIREMQQRDFEATTDFDRLAGTDVQIICVPTPLTQAREPDLSHVIGAAEAVAARLRPGRLVVLESTTYPGTTRQVVLPILEARGLRAGLDFFLAYSPEREDPGNRDFSTTTIPRLVGGVDPASSDLACALYRQVLAQVVPVRSAEIAEASKVLENTYRAVNIALVNELKVLYDRMGIDIWEVIEAARTKPFGFQPFFPGPGLGGHCIPVDPFYLAWVGRKHGIPARLIELAGEINTAMPAYVAGKIADALNERAKAVKGSRILLLGIAYKKDVDDCRESPGLALMEQLSQRGALVGYNDPHVPELPHHTERGERDVCSQPLSSELLRAQDCVVIVTDHSAYDWPWIVEHASLLVDTRNATRSLSHSGRPIVRA